MHFTYTQKYQYSLSSWYNCSWERKHKNILKGCVIQLQWSWWKLAGVSALRNGRQCNLTVQPTPWKRQNTKERQGFPEDMIHKLLKHTKKQDDVMHWKGNQGLHTFGSKGEFGDMSQRAMMGLHSAERLLCPVQSVFPFLLT